MNMGQIIRTDNFNSTKVVHYARPDPGDRVKHINITGKKKHLS